MRNRDDAVAMRDRSLMEESPWLSADTLCFAESLVPPHHCKKKAFLSDGKIGTENVTAVD
jgi:hypothetical protein